MNQYRRDLVEQARIIIANARQDWGPNVAVFAELASRLDVSNDTILSLMDELSE